MDGDNETDALADLARWRAGDAAVDLADVYRRLGAGEDEARALLAAIDAWTWSPNTSPEGCAEVLARVRALADSVTDFACSLAHGDVRRAAFEALAEFEDLVRVARTKKRALTVKLRELRATYRLGAHVSDRAIVAAGPLCDAAYAAIGAVLDAAKAGEDTFDSTRAALDAIRAVPIEEMRATLREQLRRVREVETELSRRAEAARVAAPREASSGEGGR